MHLIAFFTLVVGALLVAPQWASAAASHYTCGLTSCTCSGKDDCTDLLNSDWCKGNTVKCGKPAGLPPGECRCSVVKIAPKAVTPGLKKKPDVKAY
jgi:hypothetical protein